MISVQEAKKIISENVHALSPRILSLEKAAGLVLAEDVYGTMDIPAFPQSSMDGYAFSFYDWQKYKKLKITAEIAAGSNESISLSPGNAARIFTGAPVPSGADTVVMQEKVRANNNELTIEDENLQAGASIRPKGSEIKAGALAIRKNSLLTPPAIGFLAGIGIRDVKVYPNPSIALIITGNELRQPGKPLRPGQVYESNSFSLKAAMQLLNVNELKIFYATDNLEVLTDTLKKALQQSDVVMLTGGVSVGDYDFVAQATIQCGVEKLFHKVKQRPGKPLFFGKKQNKIVFGLPGNPSSVLVCFYQYVIPALEKLTKRKFSSPIIYAPISRSFMKGAGLTHFLKGYYDSKTVTPLDAQESFRLSSFATANCLIQIDEETSSCQEAEIVALHLLPV